MTDSITITDSTAILKECGAFLEGHFLLSSGRHSDRYFQCALLFQHPGRAAAVIAPVAAAIRSRLQSGAFNADAVVGPAIGGIIMAYELGRQLGLPAFFTERDDSGGMALRRGFEVKGGTNIIIAEDVVTTGKSFAESAAVLEAFGAKVSAAACVVDRRSGGTGAVDGLPLIATARLPAANWDAADCPLCRRGIPFVKPGSRKQQPDYLT